MLDWIEGALESTIDPLIVYAHVSRRHSSSLTLLIGYRGTLNILEGKQTLKALSFSGIVREILSCITFTVNKVGEND